MKIQIRKNLDNNMVQITTTDERWYQTSDGLFVPSVSWISGYYPKGVEFYKWLASKGWDEAQTLKSAGGIRGTKVHAAIEKLFKGEEVKMDDKFLNPQNGQMEELTVEEYECLMSFMAWYEQYVPEIIFVEKNVFCREYEYAGTADLVCILRSKVNKDPIVYLIDFKTSQHIWPEYEIQLAAYRHAFLEAGILIDKLAILQLNFKKNQNKYKFTEISDDFDTFLAAKQIWKKQAGKQQPHQKDYPLSLKIEGLVYSEYDTGLKEEEITESEQK